MADLSFADHGSIWIITPLSADGREWVDLRIDPDAQTWGRGVACEARYVGDIIEGARADGLDIAGD